MGLLFRVLPLPLSLLPRTRAFHNPLFSDPSRTSFGIQPVIFRPQNRVLTSFAIRNIPNTLYFVLFGLPVQRLRFWRVNSTISVHEREDIDNCDKIRYF